MGVDDNLTSQHYRKRTCSDRSCAPSINPLHTSNASALDARGCVVKPRGKCCVGRSSGDGCAYRSGVRLMEGGGEWVSLLKWRSSRVIRQQDVRCAPADHQIIRRVVIQPISKQSSDHDLPSPPSCSAPVQSLRAHDTGVGMPLHESHTPLVVAPSLKKSVDVYTNSKVRVVDLLFGAN